jgi:O-antigen/teichoic acid export membrane protein
MGAYIIPLFIAAVAGLIPLSLLLAVAWQRIYRDDPGNTARTIVKNSTIPIAANLLNKLIDVGFAAIVLRALGPEGNGAYAFVALIVGLYFVTISNWGLNDLTVREAAADPQRAPYLFSVAVTVRCLIALALIPCGALLAGGFALAGNPLHPGALIAFALLGLHLFPAAIAAGCSASFQAAQRMEIPALLGILTAAVRTLIGVAALTWAPDVTTRIAGLAAAALVATGINAGLFLVAQRRFLFRAGWFWDAALARWLVRESFPLLLNSLLIAVFFRFDIVILRAMHGDGAVGLYDAAYKLVSMTQIIPPYVVAALFPILARAAIDDPTRLVRTVQRAIGALQLIAWPMAVSMTLLAPQLIGVLGGAAFVRDATILLQVAIWYLPLSYLNGVVQYALIAVRQQRRITGAFLSGTLVNLALNLALVPAYGALAAAVVTVITEVALFVPLILALRRAGVAPALGALIWRPALASLVAGLGAWASMQVIGWPGAALIAVIYPLVLWLSGGIGHDERAFLRRILGHVD